MTVGCVHAFDASTTADSVHGVETLQVVNSLMPDAAMTLDPVHDVEVVQLLNSLCSRASSCSLLQRCSTGVSVMGSEGAVECAFCLLAAIMVLKTPCGAAELGIAACEATEVSPTHKP